MSLRNLLTTTPDPPQQQLYVNTLIRTFPVDFPLLCTLPQNNFFSHLPLLKIFNPKSFYHINKVKMHGLLSLSLLALSASASFVCEDKKRRMHVCCSSLAPGKEHKGVTLIDGQNCKFANSPSLRPHLPTHRRVAANAPSRPRSNRQKRQSDQEMELQLSIAHDWSRRFASRRGIAHTAAVDCFLLPYQCGFPSSYLFDLFLRSFSSSAFLPLHLYTLGSFYSVWTTITDIAQIPGLTRNYGHDCLSVSDAASGEIEGADADSSDAKRAVDVADPIDENTDEISGYDLIDSDDERPVYFDKRPVHS